MKTLPILIVSEPNSVPSYSHAGDAGADLKSSETKLLQAGQRSTFLTGVSIAIPNGYVGLVHSRSGLAAKHGVIVLNAPGTVDAGYRGEIAVTLYNSSDADYHVNAGDRIAQILFQAVEPAMFMPVEVLPGTERGAGGFGSTGTA